MKEDVRCGTAIIAALVDGAPFNAWPSPSRPASRSYPRLRIVLSCSFARSPCMIVVDHIRKRIMRVVSCGLIGQRAIFLDADPKKV